jgi:hypothetical protein
MCIQNAVCDKGKLLCSLAIPLTAFPLQLHFFDFPPNTLILSLRMPFSLELGIADLTQYRSSPYGRTGAPAHAREQRHHAGSFRTEQVLAPVHAQIAVSAYVCTAEKGCHFARILPMSKTDGHATEETAASSAPSSSKECIRRLHTDLTVMHTT